MLGEISFFVQNNGELENRRQLTKGFFISDTWRVQPRFTLTLGLRYEPYAYFYDEQDRIQTFDLAAWQQGTRTQMFDNAPPGLFYPGDTSPGGGVFGRSLMDSDNTNLAPRIGIAWDPFGDGKTSIPAAYGIYYDAPPMWGQNNYNLVAPFSYNAQFNDGPSRTEAGEPDKALATLKSIRQGPQAGQYHAVMAFAYGKRRQPERAIQSMRKARERNPLNLDHWSFIVSQLVQTSQLSLAVFRSATGAKEIP